MFDTTENRLSTGVIANISDEIANVLVSREGERVDMLVVTPAGALAEVLHELFTMAATRDIDVKVVEAAPDCHHNGTDGADRQTAATVAHEAFDFDAALTPYIGDGQLRLLFAERLRQCRSARDYGRVLAGMARDSRVSISTEQVLTAALYRRLIPETAVGLHGFTANNIRKAVHVHQDGTNNKTA